MTADEIKKMAEAHVRDRFGKAARHRQMKAAGIALDDPTYNAARARACARQQAADAMTSQEPGDECEDCGGIIDSSSGGRCDCRRYEK